MAGEIGIRQVRRGAQGRRGGTAAALRGLMLGLLGMGLAVSARAQTVTLGNSSFPLTQVGQSTTQVVTLTFSDDSYLTALPQIDSPNGEFALLPLTNNGDCAVSTPIAAGGSCTLTISFTPKLPGWASAPLPIARSAPLAIAYYDSDTSSAGSATLGLTGTGTGPVAVLTPGLISDIVGNDISAVNPASPYGGDGGPASGAIFNAPSAIAVDGFGNIYIADTQNEIVRVVYKSGTVLAHLIALENPGTTAVAGNIYTIAGIHPTLNPYWTYGGGWDGSLASAVGVNWPQGVAADAAGNVYVSDTYDGSVRLISATTGIINTVAGTFNSMCFAAFNSSCYGDQGPATSAGFAKAEGITVDGYGNLYIADSGNGTIRVVYQGGTALASLIATENSGVTAQAGYIYTIAGGVGNTGGTGDGGLATSAGLSWPSQAIADSQGNIYIADTDDNSVRRVDALTGFIGTIAQMNGQTYGIAVDASDNVYFGVQTYVVQAYYPNAPSWAPSSQVVAGIAYNSTASGDGGSATQATLSGAQSVAVDGTGSLYILEPDGVRYVNASATALAFPSALYGVVNTPQTVMVADADIVNYAIGAPYVSSTTALTEATGTTGLNVPSPFLTQALAGGSILPAGAVDCGTAAMDLTPGQWCAMAVSVQTTQDGSVTGTATYPDNSVSFSNAPQSSAAFTGVPLGFNLSATVAGGPPAVSLLGGPLTFYAIPNGGVPASQSLTLFNQSATTTLAIRSITVTTSAGFLQTNNCGSSLAPQGSCTITVTFSTTTATTSTGSLTVSDDASTKNGVQTVALTGYGVYPTVTLTGPTLVNGALNFTAIPNESALMNGIVSAVQSVTLTNTSQVPLTITAITPAQGVMQMGNNFEQLATSTCSATFPATLAAGASCTITIQFGAGALGPATSQTLTIADNAGGAGATQTVQLNGTGVASNVTITQPATQEINFGSLLPGSTSAASVVTITNNGTAPLTFCMAAPACILYDTTFGTETSGVPFQIVGVVADQYSVDGSACIAAAPLAVGASCNLNVYFKPTFAGRLNATLDINDDSGGEELARGFVSTQTVTLNGIGNVPEGASTFTVANATQFLAAVGQTQTQTVSLTLNNAVALKPMAILSGFTEYTVGTVTGCAVDGATVNPAGTVCQIPVTFAPLSPGIRTAPLIVTTTENGGTPYAFGLSGTGSGSLAVLTPGIMTQFVGGYLGTEYAGIGGPANQAKVGFLEGMVVDSAGNVFLSDEGNNTIWRIDTNGIINYYAGGPWPDYGPAFTDGGTAIDSNIALVGPLALDAADRLYLGDSDGWDTGLEGPASGHNLIRVIDPVNNIITSVAGNGVAGWPSHTRVYPGAIIQFAIGSVNYLYTVKTGGVTSLSRPLFTDVIGETYQDGTVVWVNSGKGTTTGAGCPGQTDSIGDGCTGFNALLPYAAVGLVLDQAGDVYFSDGTMVRRIDVTTGIVTIYAGNGTPGHTGDGGQATAAEISGGDLAFDSNGNLYIAEAAAVRMVAGPSSQTPGVITTVAGNGSRNPGNNENGTVCAGGSGDGGPATAAEFSGLTSIAFDAANDLYLTDGSACRVRRVDAGTHTILTVAGAGGGYLSGPSATDFGNLGDSWDGGDGNAIGAGLPQALFTRLDGMGNMYIAEFVNGVRKVNVSQSVMDYNFVYAPNFLLGVDSNVPIDTEASVPLTTTVLNAGNSGVLNFTKPFIQSPWGIDSANWTRDITNPTGSVDCYDTRKISAGYECPINTDFTPLVDGSLTGVTTVNDDAVNTPQTITLLGTAVGTPSDVTLLPFLLSFSTPQNSSSAPQVLTLFNHTAAAVSVSISLAGANLADFTIDASQCPATLAANTGCPINVTFNPLIVGGNVDIAPPPDILTAQVVVLDSDTNTPKLVSNLIGTGTLPAAAAIPLTITETIDLSDAPTVGVATPLNITEAIDLSDAPTVAVPTPLNFVEVIQVSDAEPPLSSLAPQPLNIPETIHVTDSVAAVPSTLLPIAETIHTTDAVAAVPVQITPTIAWPTPSPIVYGTALSGTQLDATASVPGSFAYNPSAGTVLAVGTRTLSVAFTPTNSVDYSSASAQVTLVVTAELASVPGIASLNPVVTKAGAPAFTLTVTGTGFVSGAVVQWNGTNRTTAWVSATQLTASIGAADVASVGTASVTVVNPSPGGGTSAVFEFAIDSAASAAGATTVTAEAATVNVTAGQKATLPVTFTSSSLTPPAALSIVATCIDLPVGVTCSYDNSTKTVTIATSASTPPGSYQIVVIFTITGQTAWATHRPVPVAMLSGLMGLPFGLLWMGGGRKRAALGGAIALLGSGLILAWLACGNDTTSVPVGSAATTQSSVAITLNVQQ